MPACQVCDDILRGFRDVATRESFNLNLGLEEEILTSTCPEHTAIVRDLSLEIQDRDNRLLPHLREAPPDIVLGPSGNGMCIKESQTQFAEMKIDLRLVHQADNPDPPGTARLLDSEWIDIDVVKRWMALCFDSHGEACENPMRVMPTAPELLVDVKRKRLVSGKIGLRYVALSYRMGNMAPFRLTGQMLEKFRLDFALDDPVLLDQLPLTVRHAILLTDALGFDYLWTDVLCMVHGGDASFADQLNKMAAIYTGAIVTVVAADGDGTAGIPGLRNISKPRKSPQQVYPIQNEHLVVPIRKVIESSYDYHTRGWTYQEFIMSPRKILLMHNMAYWMCKSCQWHEDEAHDVNHKEHEAAGPGGMVLMGGLPHLQSLTEILSEYNERNLSHDSDALPAVSGLLAVLSRQFEGGFLHGLPETFFDVALAWKPRRELAKFDGVAGTHLNQRASATKSCGDNSVSTGMPSWSWTSWRGPIEFEGPEVGMVSGFQECEFRETSPITEWYTSSVPRGGGTRRRIFSDWHLDREKFKDKSHPLPEGWTRVNVSEAFSQRDPKEYLWPSPDDHWSTTVYQHPGLSAAGCTAWYHPFPMRKTTTSTPFTIPEQTRYLLCRTWKASLWAREEQEWWQFTYDGAILNICAGENGPSIGCLFLNNHEQLKAYVGDALESDTVQKLRVDVVAINRSRLEVRQKDYVKQRYHPWRRADEVTVLWVKWEEGVAYRIATGYVKEEAWRLLELDEIDLVLG